VFLAHLLHPPILNDWGGSQYPETIFLCEARRPLHRNLFRIRPNRALYNDRIGIEQVPSPFARILTPSSPDLLKTGPSAWGGGGVESRPPPLYSLVGGAAVEGRPAACPPPRGPRGPDPRRRCRRSAGRAAPPAVPHARGSPMRSGRRHLPGGCETPGRRHPRGEVFRLVS